MRQHKIISFHPKLAAGIELALGAVVVSLLSRVETATTFLLLVGARFLEQALLVFFLVYYPATLKRWQHFLTLFFFTIGTLGWLVFIDWKVSWYIVSALFVLFPAVSFWLTPSERSDLLFMSKPYRRWRFMMTVVGLAGLWSAVTASFIFQIFTLFTWWVWLSASLLSGLIGVWWWREYGVPYSRRFVFTSVAFFLILIQIALVVALWPLGHLVSSLFLIWWWYVLWFTFRFYLSPDGFFLKKHSQFLIINGVLMILYLALAVRWR